MAFANIYLGENVQTFTSSPKFELIDMVILNIDENHYVSSPYVTIDSEAWEKSSLKNRNGTFVFSYDPDTDSWKRSSSTVNLEDYGITVTYNVPNVGAKAGDTITVNRMGESKTEENPDPKIQLHIELTRSGRTMEANCPLCKPSNRQDIADNLLASLSGYGYQPFTATGAEVNPLAELGDGITAHGVYGGLYQQDLSFNQLMSSSISAPAEQELEHEYSYETASERNYGRKFADIAAEFEIHADEIAARVTREGTGDGFSWSLIETGFSVKAGNKVIFRVDKDGTYTDGSGTFSGTITGGSITIGNNFSVDTSGNMRCSNADISGAITCTSLTVNGQTITPASVASGITGGNNYTSSGWGNYTASVVASGASNGSTALGALQGTYMQTIHLNSGVFTMNGYNVYLGTLYIDENPYNVLRYA